MNDGVNMEFDEADAPALSRLFNQWADNEMRLFDLNEVYTAALSDVEHGRLWYEAHPEDLTEEIKADLVGCSEMHKEIQCVHGNLKYLYDAIRTLNDTHA